MKTVEKNQESFSSDLKLYYKQIEESLVCSRNEKKFFLHDLKERISEYIADNGVKSVAEIEHQFGLPEDIAGSFLEGAQPLKLKRAMNWKKILLLAAIVVVLALAIYLIACFIDGMHSNRGYYTESISEYSGYIAAQIYKV